MAAEEIWFSSVDSPGEATVAHGTVAVLNERRFFKWRGGRRGGTVWEGGRLLSVLRINVAALIR